MSKNFNSHLVRTLVYTEHCGLPANLEKIRELHSPRTSPLIKETKRIQKKFNSLDSVKKVMKRLRKSSTGYSGTLFSGGPDSDSGSFNLSKKIHRESLFFDVLKLEPLKSAKKKKTESPSTDKNFQEVYKDIKEVKLLTDWNKIKKLQTSYVDNIYNYMNKTTGNPDFYSDVRIRPSFRSDTVTGRLAAQDPNSQQRIGKSSRSASVLSMYEAKPGRVIIKIDYSTFEVRGLGIVSKDKAMLKSFREMNEIKTKFRENPLSLLTKKQKLKIKKAKKKDRPALAYELAFRMLKDKTDFHKRSASTFNRIKVKKVSKKQRKGAKGFVFGSIYGMSINSIARDLGISIEDAKAIYQIFMKAMPEAVQWFSDIEKFGRDNLYVESPIGRRRRLWGYFFTRQQTTQNKMDRLARNSVIQGLCSDLNTIAASLLILYIYKKGKAKYQVPDEDAWMVTNLIHDATELEVPIVDLFKILSFLEDFFTKRLVKALKKEFNFKIKVPLEVDIEIGLDYFNLKKWDGTQKQAKEIIKWVKKLSNKAIV
jgi:DNA polymerase I-like protein with 3'-5' exonuclease and polymerase domains